MNPLISIITPTYNQSRFLDECISSVIKQSYIHWEMIIINDASTDATMTILEKWKKVDKRIKVITLDKRIGVWNQYKTYNLGLNAAKGTHIALLDSDNYWPLDKLEKQIRYFPKNAVVSFGDIVDVSENGSPMRIITYNCNKNHLNNIPTGSILYLLSDLNFYIEPNTVIIKKNILQKIGGFKKSTHYPFTDIPTFLELSLKGRFIYCNEILGYHRKQHISHWLTISKKTSAMMRSEILACIQYFAKKNEKKLREKNIHLFSADIQSSQKLTIEYKKKNKDISIMYYNIAFDEYQKARNLARKIIFDKKTSLLTKMIALILILTLPFIKQLIYIRFILSYSLYKYQKLYK